MARRTKVWYTSADAVPAVEYRCAVATPYGSSVVLEDVEKVGTEPLLKYDTVILMGGTVCIQGRMREETPA